MVVTATSLRPRLQAAPRLHSARKVRQGQDPIGGGIGGGIRGGVQVEPCSLRLRGVVQAPRLSIKQLLGTEEEEGVELFCGCQLSCQPTTTRLIGCP